MHVGERRRDGWRTVVRLLGATAAEVLLYDLSKIGCISLTNRYFFSKICKTC